MAIEQGMLDVPQLLGQVHIVIMGVLKAFDLVPKGVHLTLEVCKAGLEFWNLVHKLSHLE